MAGANGPTSAAGTPQTPNPDGGPAPSTETVSGDTPQHDKKDEEAEAPADQNEDG